MSENNTMLLPCPFCGGSPTMSHKGNDMTKKRSAIIHCRMCNVKTEVGAIRNSLDWCYKTVAAHWNKRIDIKQ